jgi:hypothetical protein
LRVVDAYWSLIYGLEQRANLYITGNHDNLFSPVIGVTRVIPRPDWPLTRKSTTGPLVIRGSNTTYLLLMHGHEVDEYCNSANPGVGHITAVLCGLAEDRLEKDGAEQSGGDIEARVMRILEAGAGLRNKLFNGPDRVAALEEGIEQYRVSANRQPAPPHYCIFGHTHHPGVFANGHNFNCGSWVYPMRTYVVYDSETGACGCQTWGGT